MRASNRWLCSLALALGAGCGGGTNPTVVDMANPAGNNDMCQCLPDMAKAAAPTGAPCVADSDCAVGGGPTKKAQCVRAVGTGMDMIQWPGGYCAAVCRMALNDMDTGLNTDCSDGTGTCEADANSMSNGHCRFACNDSTECRTGYACFWVNDVALACEPKAESECDPSKVGSCPATVPADGGVGYNDTCVNAGDETVGFCYPGCDPFKAVGCPGTPDAADCHASSLTGEGYCDMQNDTPAAAGGPCQYDGDCGPGYGCGADTKCWKYCRADGKTVEQQCGAVGATCLKLDPAGKLAASVAGTCSKSN